MTHGSNANVAEVYNQLLMMLRHEILEQEIGKRMLVDHAYIVADGEVTKAARSLDRQQPRRLAALFDHLHGSRRHPAVRCHHPAGAGDAARPLGGS